MPRTPPQLTGRITPKAPLKVQWRGEIRDRFYELAEDEAVARTNDRLLDCIVMETTTEAHAVRREITRHLTSSLSEDWLTAREIQSFMRVRSLIDDRLETAPNVTQSPTVEGWS